MYATALIVGNGCFVREYVGPDSFKNSWKGKEERGKIQISSYVVKP
jgi:hypothetical protein